MKLIAIGPCTDQPTLRPNLLAVAPQGGSTFDPAELQNSGLPLGAGPPEPYVLRFKRKGTFSYVCVVHPGMKGKVRVVGRGRDIPTRAQDRRAARRAQQSLLERVQRLTTGIGTEDLEATIQAMVKRVVGRRGERNRGGRWLLRRTPGGPGG